MKKSILVLFALVGLMLASCSNNNKTVVYSKGTDFSTEDSVQTFKYVKSPITICKTGKNTTYQKCQPGEWVKMKCVGTAEGDPMNLDSLAKANGYAYLPSPKIPEIGTSAPWRLLEWILFFAAILLGFWLLRWLWHNVIAPLPPHTNSTANNTPVSSVAATTSASTSSSAANPAPVVAPAAESSSSIVSPTSVASGPTIINNYAGGIIVQMASGGNQPAPGFTKKSTKFDFSVKGSFDEEWS